MWLTAAPLVRRWNVSAEDGASIPEMVVSSAVESLECRPCMCRSPTSAREALRQSRTATPAPCQDSVSHFRASSFKQLLGVAFHEHDQLPPLVSETGNLHRRSRDDGQPAEA